MLRCPTIGPVLFLLDRLNLFLPISINFGLSTGILFPFGFPFLSRWWVSFPFVDPFKFWVRIDWFLCVIKKSESLISFLYPIISLTFSI